MGHARMYLAQIIVLVFVIIVIIFEWCERSQLPRCSLF